MKQLPEFKIHPSSCGKIMTNDRSGTKMGQTCKSYLEKWVKEQIYGVREVLQSKYLDKGNYVEQDAIEYVGENLNWFMAQKNTKTFENEYMIGTPDVILPEEITDVKCSWDIITFPLFDETIPDKDYEWQVQCYMDLTGKKKASVIYTLMETPDEVPAYWTSAIPEDLKSFPFHLRHKKFNFDYDADKIEAIKKRVLECRIYIKEILKLIAL